MSINSILRIAALYHALFGLVLLLQPEAFHVATQLEPRSDYLFPGLVGGLLLAGSAACEAARRSQDLLKGVGFLMMLSSLVAAGVGLFWVVWADLSPLLYASVGASGLWAYLFWGVYSPES